MTTYTVWLETPEVVGYRRIPLLDEKAGAVLPDSPLTREIKDGIFDGTFEFSILPGHEAYDAVRLRRSTVYVYDDGEEVFRGRPIWEETDLYGEKRYVCEGEMNFLADVPNVFSKKIKAERSDRIGNEEEAQRESMTEIPRGKVRPGATNEDRLTRFGESRSYQGKTVYRSCVSSDDAVTGFHRFGTYGYEDMSVFSLYHFELRDEGAYFDVEYEPNCAGRWTDELGREWENRLHYKIPLRVCSYDTTLYRGSGMYQNFYKDPLQVTATAYYIGNIGLIAGAGSLFHYDADELEEEISVRAKPGGPAGEDAGNERFVKIGELPFCIVHYTQAQHWEISGVDAHGDGGLLFWGVWEETIIYATSTDSLPAGWIKLNVYRQNESDIAALYRSVFCPWGEEQGYNAYVPPERRIYRGNATVFGRLEHADTKSCLSDLKEWLEETGGFAKTRRVSDENGDRRVLDLLTDSGEKREDFYVMMDENLLDAERTKDCAGIVTGVYLRGVWDEYEVTLESVATKTAETAQEMTDETRPYLFTGETETYETGGYYSYYAATGKWARVYPTQGNNAVQVRQLSEMTERGTLYQLIADPYNSGTVKFEQGKTYFFSSLGRWEADPEAERPRVDDGFTADFERGVLWHDAARKLYGEAVSYLETDVAEIEEGKRLQYIVAMGQDEIRENLTAFESFEIDATDPRLISVNGGRPELGNYYPVELPHLGIRDYKRLTKIKTNPADAGECRMTFGGRLPTLSDYVAKKGERV